MAVTTTAFYSDFRESESASKRRACLRRPLWSLNHQWWLPHLLTLQSIQVLEDKAPDDSTMPNGLSSVCRWMFSNAYGNGKMPAYDGELDKTESKDVWHFSPFSFSKAIGRPIWTLLFWNTDLQRSSWGDCWFNKTFLPERQIFSSPPQWTAHTLSKTKQIAKPWALNTVLSENF